jgi:hypothetical protein
MNIGTGNNNTKIIMRVLRHKCTAINYSSILLTEKNWIEI